MTRKLLIMGPASLIALVLLALAGSGSRVEAGGDPGAMTAMSLDANTAGNDIDVIGPYNVCVEADPGQTATLDLTADNIPADYPLVAFSATIDYSASALTVTGNDTAWLITFELSSVHFPASQPTPDNDGAFQIGALDAADPNSQPSPSESGDGVLARVEFTVDNGTPDGLYNVGLRNAAHISTDGLSHVPLAVNGARIAVGALTCTQYFEKGDVDCNNTINSVDALKVIRHSAGLSVAQTEPCDNIGAAHPFDAQEIIGDMNCNPTGNPVNSVDALFLLRHSAALMNTYPAGCDPIGTQ